jgi:tetratricopeptide (TPR) repeat protein
MELVAINAGWNTITAYKLLSTEKIVWRGTQEILDPLVEGEIFEVNVTREWKFGNTQFIAGDIASHRIDIPALGLEPLPVHKFPRQEYEMEQVLPGANEDFTEDPIIVAVDFKNQGQWDEAFHILYKALEKDLRCIDAYVHLGNFRFYGSSPKSPFFLRSYRNYQVGVAMGEFFLGSDFKGRLPWGLIDNRPYLRALYGESLVLWAMDRFEEAADNAKKILKLSPSDNLGVRFILPQLKARVKYNEVKDD